MIWDLEGFDSVSMVCFMDSSSGDSLRGIRFPPPWAFVFVFFWRGVAAFVFVFVLGRFLFVLGRLEEDSSLAATRWAHPIRKGFSGMSQPSTMADADTFFLERFRNLLRAHRRASSSSDGIVLVVEGGCCCCVCRCCGDDADEPFGAVGGFKSGLGLCFFLAGVAVPVL